MDAEDIKRLVREEVLRPEIQALLNRKEDQKEKLGQRLGRFLRQPIALTLIGFFLTSIVGTIISQNVANRSQRDAERVAALEAVRQFASDAAELRVQQDLLASAMFRQTGLDALEGFKQRYDEAFLLWNSGRYRNYLAVRSFFGFTYANFAEQLISRTIHQDFRAMNVCLTQSYDVLVEEMEGQAQLTDRRALVEASLDTCLADRDRPGVQTEDQGYLSAFDRRQSEIFQCSRQIFDPLHHFITHDLHCGSESWQSRNGAPSRVEQIYDAVWDQCGVGDKIAYNSYGESARAFCTKDDGWLSRMTR